MTWKHLRIVAIDIETTGFFPAGDRILALAARVFKVGEGAAIEAEAHSWLLNPEMPMEPHVTMITGLTSATLAGQPTFGSVASDVSDLLVGAIVVAHNLGLDRSFLTEELRRVGRPWPATVAEIDTLALSVRAFPRARAHWLPALCRRLGVRPPDGHGAVAEAEARATGLCFLELVRREGVADELGALVGWGRGGGERS